MQHAPFDEAWYMQPIHPPVAQVLYDLGLEANDSQVSESGPAHTWTLRITPPCHPH
jgi:hypothetical protein